VGYPQRMRDWNQRKRAGGDDQTASGGSPG
jgi:hypothetical protein